MTDYQTFLTKLQQNLNTLREREAKHGGNAPLELLNQITDHREAITLTEQALTGQLTESEWRNALHPLLIAIQARSGDETASSVSIGDIGGSIQDSTIAGRDVNQITVNVINLLGQEAADADDEPEPFIRSLKDLILKQVDAIDPRTAQRYPQNPAGYTDPLRDALTELLEADKGLAARLDALLGQYEQAQHSGSGPQITLSGTGNISYGQGNIGVTNIGPGVAIGQARDVYLQPPPTDPIQARRQEARQRYLTALRRHCQVLPLAALGGEEGADEDLSLDQVYIDLDTTHKVPLTKAEKARRRDRPADLGLEREAEERILTALEAAAQTPRLALLGDPGAGKSTFVRKLIGWQAAALLGEGQSPPGCTASLLPILLTLRDLTPRLAVLDLASLSGEARQQALAAVVRDQFLAELDRLEVAELADDLRRSLTSGECLLVLDGLDEVPQALRQRIRQATAAVISLYGARRIILTCRVRSYVGEAVLPNFQAFTLAPFSEDKIRAFSRAWYQAQQGLGRVEAGQVTVKGDNLTEAALAEDLRELAENPMLLTTMALIHQKEIGLPNERVRLYSLAVEVLLQRWQKRKSGETGLTPSAALTAILQDNLRLRQVVERLAFEAQRAGRGQRQAADLPRGEALLLLEQRDYLGQTALADEFLDYVDQRAGLLLGRGGELGRPTAYSFPHRTFQEYLAGCYLISRRNAARGFYERAGEGDMWALAAQLGGEELLYNLRRTADVLDLAYHLCPIAEPGSEQARRAGLWSGQMAALVGVEAIQRDSGGPEEGAAYLQRLLPRLVSLLESELSAPERVEAGRVLAKLGDPRSGVGLRPAGLPDILWCEVPAGPFVMGSEDDALRLSGKETPQHQADLPAYRMSRYPITQVQYRTFVEAGGYQEADYWREAAAAGYWQDNKVKRRVYTDGKFVDEWATAPFDYGPKFSLSNQPVVGINWWEALAFCDWLTARLREAGELDSQEVITLPSERQWEKAARGPDGRIYPWGNEADPNRANYADTGINTSSAVGCFPGGRSPYGCEDMAGNVWEWCRTRFERSYENYGDNNDLKENPPRVLRGGSFNFNGRYVRCAARLNDNPDFRYYDFGFRVCLMRMSPFSSL